jgi:glycosyltransferase involved in cell wall biosynthesis
MRVHQIVTDYSMYTGGAQRVVRALHVGLRKRNIEAYILGLVEQKDYELTGTRSLGLKSPYTLRAIFEIQRYLRKNVSPGDIVHVHLFPPLIYLSFLRIMGQVRCHLVCTEHSTSNRRRGTFFGRMLDLLTYAGYERIVAISAGVEQELLHWKPNLKGRTKIVFNGANLPFQHEIQRKPRQRLKVLSLGNLRPAKNYANALKALALLEDLDFEYHIAGEGELRAELQQLCQELGLEAKVRFLGYVEAIPELLAATDIFLMPSKWEGFGLAAVEAMNASLPLVVTNVAGLREVVNNVTPCALLVDPEDPEAIATAVRQLLLSPVLRLQLGKNAFRQAAKFSVDQMVEYYLNLYVELT